MPATKKAAAPTKPTYAVMVFETIKSLGNNRTGSSMPAISKALGENFKLDVNKNALSKAIKKGVESGDLVRVKASYKLGKKPVVTPAPPKKKPAPQKKKATTTAKPAAKSDGATKKASVTKTKKKTASSTASLKPKKVVKKTTKKSTASSTKSTTKKATATKTGTKRTTGSAKRAATKK